LSIAVGQGFEAYSFSTPFGYIFPTVKSTAKAFRIPRNSPPDYSLSWQLKSKITLTGDLC